jgi:hypothetical protein
VLLGSDAAPHLLGPVTQPPRACVLSSALGTAISPSQGGQRLVRCPSCVHAAQHLERNRLTELASSQSPLRDPTRPQPGAVWRAQQLRVFLQSSELRRWERESGVECHHFPPQHAFGVVTGVLNVCGSLQMCFCPPAQEVKEGDLSVCGVPCTWRM